MAQLRLHEPEWSAAGWSLFGITAQRADAVSAFAAEQAIPFPLLLDDNRAVSKLYGVYTLFRADDGAPTINSPHNATFLIDGAGHIRFVYDSSRSNEVPSESELVTAVAQLG
jgi:peroxiredoxin